MGKTVAFNVGIELGQVLAVSALVLVIRGRRAEGAALGHGQARALRGMAGAGELAAAGAA